MSRNVGKKPIKKRKTSKNEVRKKKTGVRTKKNGVASKLIDQTNKQRIFTAIFLFVVAFAVFIPSIHNELVWDDIEYVEKSSDEYKSASIDIGMFIPSFEKREGLGQYYRPVYSASLILDYKIWGMSPLGYHISNIILHSMSTVLLYFLILLLFIEYSKESGDSIAFVAAIIFAVYPMHVESVSLISARGDLLASIFFFICFISYILSYRVEYLYQKISLILLACASLYMSLLSKEVAFSFPIIIFGFDLIGRRLHRRENLIKYFILGSLVVFYLYARSKRYIIFPEIDLTQNNGDAFSNILEILRNLLLAYEFYIEKLIFPYNLNTFITKISGGSISLMLSIVMVVAVCIAFLISFRLKENVSAFCLLWIFATLGPAVVISIFPTALTRYAERFLYLPSAGYCLLIGYAIIFFGKKRGARKLVLVISFILIASFASVTVHGQKIWKNHVLLWQTAVQKNPKEFAPRLNYANALRDSGNLEEAIGQYKIALRPDMTASNEWKSKAAHGLAVTLYDKGDFSKSENFFKVARDYNKEYTAQYHYHVGVIRFRLDDLSEAQNHLERYIELEPRDAKANYVLAHTYIKQAISNNSVHKLRLAEESLKRSLKINPYMSNARLSLAQVYFAVGEKEKAREQAKMVIDISTNKSEIDKAKSILGLN